MDTARFDELMELGRNELVGMIDDLEAKNVELENSYEKLAEAFDDLNVQNNYHCAKNVELYKHNELLEQQLNHVEAMLTDVQADKFRLREELEIVRNCAVRYLDAEDMVAKRTCDKELLKALAAINGEGV